MLIKTINCGHFAERGFEIYPDDSRAPYVTLVNIGAAYLAMTWASDNQALCCHITSLGAYNDDFFDEIFTFSTIPIQTYEHTTTINSLRPSDAYMRR